VEDGKIKIYISLELIIEIAIEIERILGLPHRTGEEENAILLQSAPEEVCSLSLDHLTSSSKAKKR
jgi:hypothetical protein